MLHVFCHSSFGLLGPLHDGAVVVVGSGQHVVAGEQEDGCKAEQRKVDAIAAGMGSDGIQAVGRRDDAHDKDGQRHIAVHRLALQLGTLAALGCAELIGEGRLCFQIFLCPAQHRDAVAGFVGQFAFRQLAGGLFGFLLLQHLLTGCAEQMDLRLLFGQHLQQLVHVAFILEVALLLLAAVVLHHKVGHGGKHALAGKAAGAHSHPLEHAGDAGVGQVVAAVDVKAVQIQGFFAHAAGADLPAGFFVCLQLQPVQFCHAQLCGSENHGSFPSLLRFASIFAPYRCKCNPFGR